MVWSWPDAMLSVVIVSVKCHVDDRINSIHCRQWRLEYMLQLVQYQDSKVGLGFQIEVQITMSSLIDTRQGV